LPNCLLEWQAPSTTVKTSKDELVKFFKDMYTMRRMEITNDTEYKVRYIFSIPNTSKFNLG
jgi:TPP-dependent pyruvate/acetoin dehydrogenase alpha subunit